MFEYYKKINFVEKIKMYNILYENPDEDLFTRLLKIRNVDEEIENFLNPTFSKYWIDPFLLNDINLAIDRIKLAIKKNEKIMIFGDYDVDWITSSFLIYTFFTKYLWYNNISIRLPNRLEDWYWIKTYHLDEIHSLGVSLVITVDNWITAINEALHAKKLWIDMIITDHHKNLDELPDAFATINPHVSPNYSFKWLAWVWVAFKFISALANNLISDSNIKKDIINYLLPIVSIGTVADCVPLVNENRLFVKMWLDIINQKKWIPPSLDNLLKYLKIKWKIDTFHIWYLIAPRLNASGRMITPYESLHCLLNHDSCKQLQYLDKMEELNTKRKKLQDDSYKQAEKIVDLDKKVLIYASEELHDWIVWLVAWRLTEKYHKPSVVFAIKPKEWIAVASLRWPEYFDIVAMLNKVSKYLITYWGHKQAGWLTSKIENLQTVVEIFYKYWEKNIKKKDTIKTINVDTYLYPWEFKDKKISEIEKLAPFGEGNQEPVFMLEWIVFDTIEKVWKNWNWHMKIHANKSWVGFPILFWGKWGEIENVERNIEKNIIWKVRSDNFSSNWFFVDGMDIIN